MLTEQNLQHLRRSWALKHTKLCAKLALVPLCRDNIRRAPVLTEPSRQLRAQAWLLLVNGQQFGAVKLTKIMQDCEALLCTGNNKGSWSRLQEDLFGQGPLNMQQKRIYIQVIHNLVLRKEMLPAEWEWSACWNDSADLKQPDTKPNSKVHKNAVELRAVLLAEEGRSCFSGVWGIWSQTAS